MSTIKNPLGQLDPKAIDQMVETFTAIGKAMREAAEEMAEAAGEKYVEQVVRPRQAERVSKGTHVMGLDGSIEEVKPLTNEEDVARQNDYEVDRFSVPLDWGQATTMLRTVPIRDYLVTRRDLNEANVVKDMFERQATNWGAELRTLYQLLDCVENNKAIDALKQLLAERDALNSTNKNQAELLRAATQRADNANSELVKTKERVEDLKAMLPTGHPESTRPAPRKIKDQPQA